MAAQDLGELFDVVDEHGRPLGIRKPRGEVHRDGDWHRSLHVWVLLTRGPEGAAATAQPWVLLQRRSPHKDTWPGAVDVAVTGHYAAGEHLEDALREAEEEIGLPLAAADVVQLGTHRRVDDHAPPVVDREIQEILLATTPLGLAALRPAPDEIAALLAVPLDAALALARGEVSSADALEIRPGAPAPAPVALRLADLVDPVDGYYRRALEAIARRVAGEDVPPWAIDDARP